MFIICCLDLCYHCFFFNDTATTEIYTLSLHDALPISISTSRLWPTACVGPLESTRLPSGPLWDIVSSCPEDRKSTRLNSSHANISYAVFCLKKKKNKMAQSMNTHLSAESTRKYSTICR